ncbi:hypothetical protein ACFWUP_21880 [Nocardia sp. NPDC058658]|uniref:hypothetical protein n=1 Tax=Nocardia sp. NPDC058658 TaxID=3346580 RepID=UPI0036522A6F
MGRFTDRGEIIAAFDRFAQSDEQLLMLWGLAGMGKSRIVAELAARTPAGQSRVIDLTSVIAANYGQLPQGPAGELLARIADALSSWTDSKRLKRYFSIEARKAIQILRAGDVRVVIQAKNNSSITGNVIQIANGPDAEAFAAHRRRLVAALTELARHIQHPGIILIDTSELLALLDDIAHEQGPGQPPLGHWFTHSVLPELARSNPRIKVVTAGRDCPTEPAGVIASIHELADWSLEHTTTFLQSCGIDNEVLIAEAHRLCRGVPLWLALIAEFNQELQLRNVSLTVEQLRLEASGRPAETWLTETLLERLSPTQKRVLKAAAIPRLVTEEIIGELIYETTISEAWFSRFTRHSFVKSTGGTFEIHALVRESVLTQLERGEPRLFSQLQRVAADYFRDVGQTLEEAYHRFAIGDLSLGEWWSATTEAAIIRQDLGNAVLHLDAVMGQEDRLRKLGAEQLLARGYYLTGRLNYFRNKMDDALTALADANARFSNIGDKKGVADTLTIISRVEHQTGSVERARKHVEDSLLLYRSIQHTAGIGEALRDLCWIDIRLGSYERATELALECANISESINNNYAHAESLRALSWIKRQQNDLPAAESTINKSLQLYDLDRNRRGRANALIAHIEIMIDMNDFYRASAAVTELLNISQSIEYLAGTSVGNCLLAYTTLGAGKPYLAIEQATAAFMANSATKLPFWQARSLIVRSKAFIEIEQHHDAMTDALQAMDIYTNMPDEAGISRVATLIAEIERRTP